MIWSENSIEKRLSIVETQLKNNMSKIADIESSRKDYAKEWVSLHLLVKELVITSQTLVESSKLQCDRMSALEESKNKLIGVWAVIAIVCSSLWMIFSSVITKLINNSI